VVIYYTMARMRGVDVAGFMQRACDASQPSAWNVYIATDDVDATVKNDAGLPSTWVIES